MTFDNKRVLCSEKKDDEFAIVGFVMSGEKLHIDVSNGIRNPRNPRTMSVRQPEQISQGHTHTT